MTTDKDSGKTPVIETLDGIEYRTQKLEVSTRKYASAISAAFASAVTSGKSFDDVLKSLALRMSQMAVQAAMRPLVGGIVGGLGGLFSGGSIAAPGYMPSPAGRGAALPPPPAASPGFAPTNGAPAASPRVSIHISTPDAESFRRSEAYVTGQIARAVARGQRTL
jgi:hypothetical protein